MFLNKRNGQTTRVTKHTLLGYDSPPVCFPYRSEENNFPMQLCRGRRIMSTAIPARHDIPISIQSRTLTAMACSGPAHRKCKNTVTLEEKDKACLGLFKNEPRERDSIQTVCSDRTEQMRT